MEHSVGNSTKNACSVREEVDRPEGGGLPTITAAAAVTDTGTTPSEREQVKQHLGVPAVWHA